MAELKTKPTGVDPAKFVDSIKDERRRADAQALLAMMTRVTGETPRMWGSAIVGFGSYHYTYATGREGDWCITGFSPRKDSLTVYILPGLHLQQVNLKKLGKVTTGKSCIYIRDLGDVHMPTLEKMVKQAGKDITKVAAAMRKLRKEKRAR
jgi:hypothetical protein